MTCNAYHNHSSQRTWSTLVIFNIARGAFTSVKPPTNAMRVTSISLLIVFATLFAVACGQGADETPVDTSSPTEVPTATRAPVSTPTTVPTEAIPTPTAETAPAANVVETPAATTKPESAAPQPTEPPAAKLAPERDLDIVTLLPPDAIPAINNPMFFDTTEEADTVYGEGEYVLGVEIDGDARAYSVPLLSSHEIVNDTVGGRPIAVTW